MYALNIGNSYQFDKNPELNSLIYEVFLPKGPDWCQENQKEYEQEREFKERPANILPRIVCERRADELLRKARKTLGPLADVEEYHLNIRFTHETWCT